MRYKELVSNKLEQLGNMINFLTTINSQGYNPVEFRKQVDRLKEKLSEIQTLINTEQQDGPNKW